MLNYTAILFSLSSFDSPSLAGLAYGLCFGTPIIFGWIAGAYIDRYSAKKVLLIAQNLFIVGALGMWWAVENKGDYEISVFLFSSFLIGIAWAFVAPARMASIAQYASTEKLPQLTIIFNLLVMLGFGLAPILLTQIQEYFAWQGVLEMCVFMFLLSSVLLFNAPNVHKRISHDRLIKEWTSCFEKLKTIPIVPQLLLAAIVVYLMMGPMQVVLPQVAEGLLKLNSIDTGRYLGLIALSLILGGVIAIKFKEKVPVGPTILWLLIFSGVAIGFIGNINSIVMSCLALIAGTTMAGIIVSFIVAALQYHTPTEIKGRVMSIYTIISQVISAIAGLLAGVIAEGISPSMSLYIIGALIILFTLLIGIKATHLRNFRGFKS